MKTLGNFIHGQFSPAISGAYLEDRNPATGELIAQIPDSDAADINVAVAAAKKAFPVWSQTPVRERAKILNKIADLVEARIRDFAQIETMDQGKPLILSTRMDIPRVVDNFRFFASQAMIAQDESTRVDEPVSAVNYIRRKPIGVAGLISPWNLPLYLLSWKIAPALAFGNTVVAKPSELTPFTAFMLAEVMQKSGLPPGVCNIVHGLGSKAGAALVEHPDVPLISFTGGTSTGETIARTAAPLFKKLSLELGGKNANIIFADCDFDAALETSVRSSFLNQGEICLCGSRIFVHREIYDRFVKSFTNAATNLVVGDPLDPRTFLGPVVSPEHLAKVQSYLRLTREEGGVVLCGGEKPELRSEFAKGHFMTPAVVVDLDVKSRVMQEEIFGPVVTITPFDSEAEVIHFANNVRYGLSATVWSQNIKRAHRVAEALDVGTVWINCWLVRDLRVPFGGVKASGVGREGGLYSRDFFTEAKTICVSLD